MLAPQTQESSQAQKGKQFFLKRAFVRNNKAQSLVHNTILQILWVLL
jgi:hypothetical protein